MPPPKIIKHPMDRTDPVTQTAVLVCVGQGYGVVDANWIRRRGSIEGSPPDKSVVTTIMPDNTGITSILTVPDLRDNDGGSYKCRYKSSGGETDSDIAILTIASKCIHYFYIHDLFILNV